MLGKSCSRRRDSPKVTEDAASDPASTSCQVVLLLSERSGTRPQRRQQDPDKSRRGVQGTPGVNYQERRRLNTRFPGPAGRPPSSVTVNVTTSSRHRRLSQPPLSPSPPFLPALAAGSVFHTWRLIARVKVFSASVFPRGAQRGGGGRPSAAGFTEKIAQNCLIPEQISDRTQSRAKCYCALQFGHYTLSFPFRDSHPIKEYSPPSTCSN